MLLNLVGRTLSKYTLISNHNDVCFKYNFSCQLYLNKVGEKKKKDSLSEYIKSYSTRQGKKGVKKFLDFEYKRLCILYLSISSITFLTVAL